MLWMRMICRSKTNLYILLMVMLKFYEILFSSIAIHIWVMRIPFFPSKVNLWTEIVNTLYNDQNSGFIR